MEQNDLKTLAENSNPTPIEEFVGMSEETPSIFPFTEMQVTKLDVKPGNTLAVTFKTDNMDEITYGQLSKNMKKAFPDNKVLVFVVGSNDGVTFTEISANKEVSSCNTGNYCVDCNCGKKEQYEGNQ